MNDDEPDDDDLRWAAEAFPAPVPLRTELAAVLDAASAVRRALDEIAAAQAWCDVLHVQLMEAKRVALAVGCDPAEVDQLGWLG